MTFGGLDLARSPYAIRDVLGGNQEWTMFVVVTRPMGDKPFKVFTDRAPAESEAARQIQEDADEAAIFEVPGVSDARQAVAAIKMGEGVLIAARTQQATAKQISDYNILDELGLLDS